MIPEMKRPDLFARSQHQRAGKEEAKGVVIHAEVRVLPKNAHEKRVEAWGKRCFKVAEALHTKDLPLIDTIVFMREDEVIATWKHYMDYARR